MPVTSALHLTELPAAQSRQVSVLTKKDGEENPPGSAWDHPLVSLQKPEQLFADGDVSLCRNVISVHQDPPTYM